MFSFSRSARRAAANLYNSLVGAARTPALYAALGVADSIEGRYEMITLHAALLLRRIQAEGRGYAALAQALVDYMAADLDRSIRELGVGDLGVSRYMKRLGEGFYGRGAAYVASLENGAAPGALAEALQRNVFGGADPGGRILAAFDAYVRHQSQHLAAIPIARIAAGQIDFIAPEDEAA